LYSIKLAFIGWLCLFIAGCSHSVRKPEPSDTPEETAMVISESPLSQTPVPAPAQCNEYTVKLTVQPAEQMVTGNEKIKINNTSNNLLDKVYLNVPLNAFTENAAIQPVFDEFMDKAYPNGKDYGYMVFSNIYVDGEAVRYSLNGTVLSITLPESVPPGESTELRLDLQAKIPVMHDRTGSDEDSIWFGNFLPLLAVHDAEGWHTDPYYPAGAPFYARAANFNVSVTAPSEYTAAGPGIPVVTENDGTKTTAFTLKLARDFAFSLSRRYTLTSITTPSNVEINLYTFSDSARSQEITDLAARSLDYYSSRIGAYPYSQLVIAETRLYNEGGMDYPGVIFLDEDCLQPLGDLTCITHEIGLQWFYNIIGSNQIEHAWMSEGFNSFVQDGFTLNGSALDRKMEEEYESLNAIISQISPNSLNSSLGEFKSWPDYYNIQCIRGKLMFYSLYKKMGPDFFNAFMVEYNRRFSFRIAAPDDLIQTAEDISGMNLGAFFNGWINDPKLPPLTS